MERERDRRARKGASCPSRKTRRVSSTATETRSIYSERSIDNDRSLSRYRATIHQFFHEERCGATQRGVRQRTIARIDRRIEKDVDLTSFSKIRKAETRRV